MYCFRVELSAEGAKRGVEITPEVFFPDNPPRPSRPKAGLGLVMIMMIQVNMLNINQRILSLASGKLDERVKSLLMML